MKKNIILVLSSIALGILFTFFVLNKEDIYAKGDYTIYAFQTGAYKTYDSALASSTKPSIIISDDGLYKVYIAMYKDSEVIDKMLTYFNSQNIDVYLKMLKVNKEFYEQLKKYEELVKKIEDSNSYPQINQSILNLYLEKENDNL